MSTQDGSVGAEVAATAAQDARAAADRAGLTVRSLHSHADLDAARAVWDLTWPSTLEGTQVTPNLLRALEHAGCYVAGAFDGEQMVGAALALVGREEQAHGWQVHLHSHMAAAVPGQGDRGVGTALKLHQRAWSLARGIEVVVWTFDPLVRRNARVNLVKLGGTAAEYLPDFYGDMPDEVNQGDPSDRLLLRWELTTARVADAVSGRRTAPVAAALREDGAVPAIAVRDGVPVATGDSGGVTLVALPADVVSLRRSDPALASAWRAAVRDALHPLLDSGGVVTGLTVEGDYVVEAR